MDDAGTGGGDSVAHLKSAGFAKTLGAAMDDFAEALTYRWREVITREIVYCTDNFPTRFGRHTSSFDQPLWDYGAGPAPFHLAYFGGQCAYVQWVDGGQEGSLAAVTCDGATGSMPDNPYRDENDQPVPTHIQCGMGSLLQMVEDWARGERDAIYEDMPLFDGNDVNVIESAYNTFLKVGGELGLVAGENSGDLSGTAFSTTGERELVSTVKNMSPTDATSQVWWEGWTGLAADTAKAGFFASLAPTLNNQAGIAGVLANLYAARAAIIVQGRNDALYWTQWATKSLKETQTITTSLVATWKAVQGLGTAITIPGSFYPPVAAIGATVTLVGFLGENLVPTGKSEGYAYELTEVMNRYAGEVGKLNTTLDGLETEFADLVRRLRETIWSLHSFNLELYDLTENSSRGDHTSGNADTYTANVGDILRIAEFCYDAGDQYSGLRSSISDAADADAHLTGKDGTQTPGGVALLEVRDQFGSFVETAYGRCLLAGDQTRASAEEYVKVETDQKGDFDRVMADWDSRGIGDHDGVDPGKLADDTDRGDKPNPTASDEPAPYGDGKDYVTDENS